MPLHGDSVSRDGRPGPESRGVSRVFRIDGELRELVYARPMATRRTFLQVGASVAALLGTQLGRAQDRKLDIPEVDKLTLQVVVDNATFGPFLPDQTLPGMQVIRASGDAGLAHMRRNPLMAEFGLSVIAQSQRSSEARAVIVDLGYSATVLANNLSVLGIDATQLDAAVLSHGHLDHYGGFQGLLPRGSAKAHRLPLVVGGEEVFCERLALIGDPPPLMGSLDRKQLARAGFEVRIESQPTLVADHAFTTGVIPLQGFERAAIPTQMRPGVGCAVEALAPAKRSAHQLADDGEHELATSYVVKGLGLVVISSCSHRGVLNSIRRAQAVSGIDKVHAIVGGFHLVRPRTEDEARRTAAEMAEINPRYIVPMHCTGEVFIAEALRLMPEKIVRPYVGTRFVFSA
jgi:7,8-dihydropterin-6-yl-methyl-4-(beta-D-ribofuranosyl)aminobenzene 5'-phosphate synthase